MKAVKTLIAAVLSACLIAGFAACGSGGQAPDTTQAPETDAPETTTAAQTEEETTMEIIPDLLAGAGAGEIDFPEEMFPMSEGFSGVDQAPHARVLLLQNDIQIAIVAMELVNTPADVIANIKSMVSEKTGTPEGNVWVSSSHAFCTPHAPQDEENLKLFNEAVLKAAEEAIDAAAADIQPAFIGNAAGECDVNVNHEMFVGDKWIDSAPNPDRPSDKTLSVVRVQNADGEDIALMFSYGVRSSCADAPRGTESGRMITPDLTGEACLALEDSFGVPVLYLNSAAADQMPREVALYNKVSEDGASYEQVWDAENGIQNGLDIAKEMGKELADAVQEIADGMAVDGEGLIGHAKGSYNWDNTAGDAQINIPVEVITIDGLAMAAVKTELCAETAISFREAAAGFDNAIALTFVNGDQSYMPAASTYDEGTKVSTKSSLKQGAAEEFIKVAIEMLNGELERTNADSEAAALADAVVFEGTDAESAGSIITLGSIDWLVLAEVDGRQLVIAKDVVSVGAFHDAGGQVTWENSSIRAFLNGEFLDMFSDEEKARIADTTCANKANATYAAGSGADTVDKVFLLSEEEANGYFASDEDRIAIDPATGNTTTWWLRTSGKDPAFAATVLTNGSIYPHGNLCGEAESSQAGDTYEASGVRPAMWITK